MRVTLNANDQYDADGPQVGARGDAYWITYADGDVYFAVRFDDFPDGFYHVPMKDLLWPNTESTETFWTSVSPVGESDDGRTSDTSGD